MKLDKHITVDLPYIKGSIFGGSFLQYTPGTRRLVGVKMAAEIDRPHEISIPTHDFSVPAVGDMQSGIISALEYIRDGSDVYAGCMGGIGRTGLFMGCVVSCVNAIHAELARSISGFETTAKPVDPVAFVRKHYLSHALETQEQQAYARGFNAAPVVDWYMVNVWAIHNPEPVVQVLPVIKEVPVYLSPWDWAMHTLFGTPKP